MSVKLTGWRRVLPIFYALLLVLLVLWSFWQIGPQFVSNLGKLIDSISASPKLEAWIEDVKKNYQFYVFCFLCLSFSWDLPDGLASGYGIKKQSHGAKNWIFLSPRSSVQILLPLAIRAYFKADL
jgi:hypothetical protein